MIFINPDNCVNCGSCVDICPVIAIKKDSTAQFQYKTSCMSCFHCIAICPSKAISTDTFSFDSFEESSSTHVSMMNVRELLENRRSVRRFDDREVPKALLTEIIRAASYAPSAKNEGGVEFSICTDRLAINRLDKLIFKKYARFGRVMDGQAKQDFERYKSMDEDDRQLIFRNAPVLIIAHSSAKKLAGKHNCTVALDHVLLLAQSSGLGGCWIGYLEGIGQLFPDIVKSMRIPKENNIHCSIILGWPKYKYLRRIPRQSIPVNWLDTID